MGAFHRDSGPEPERGRLGATQAGENKEAFRVALEADKARPEARNDQLAQFFHRNPGGILLSLNEPARAVPHFKIALEKNKNPGSVEGVKSSLARAIEKSGQ